MGQYWIPVNLTKREFIDPHKLGAGLKLWEQLANSPGTGEALLVLCAAMPEVRGGGDFDLDENYHGPERKPTDSGAVAMPDGYTAIAKRTIGRWAGDRIALVGDYAEDGDLPKRMCASKIYGKCGPDDNGKEPRGMFHDVTDDVVAVIEHELNGKYVGDGWRHWEPVKED